MGKPRLVRKFSTNGDSAPLESAKHLERVHLRHLSLMELFLRAAREFPDRVFLKKYSEKELSYQEGMSLIGALASQLTALGLKRGDHIVCYAERPLPMIPFFLACGFIGAIPVPISPIFSAAYIEDVMQDLKTKWLFSDVDGLSNLKDRGLRAIYFDSTENVDGEAWVKLDFNKKMDAQFARSFLENLSRETNAEHILIFQPTSGSTGKPKIVMRKHVSLTHYAEFLLPQLDTDAQSAPKYLILMSMAHSLGYHHLTSAISLAATIVIPSSIDTLVSLEEIRQLDPTILPMPPRVLQALHRQYIQTGGEESSKPFLGPGARTVMCGGGQGAIKLYQLLKQQGVEPLEIYSTSETAMIAITPRGQLREGCAGLILPNISVRIANDNEILVKTEAIMAGYFNLSSSEAMTADGYFCTGDKGEILEDGNIKIFGRKKDVFNTPEGSNIFPARIEAMLEEHPSITQAFLVGDCRPYVSAIVVVQDLTLRSEDPTGYLSPETHPTLYESIREGIEKTNSRLEAMEQIVRFAVLSKPFSSDLYMHVAGSKVRRDRNKLLRDHSSVIDWLYKSPAKTDVSFTRSRDRRLRPWHQRD